MPQEGDHIRCSASCRATAAADLVLAKCGRCIFHDVCVPTHCRCGRTAAPVGPIGKRGCFVKNCRGAATGWSILCPKHVDQIAAAAISRIALVGSMYHAALVSFLAYFPGVSMSGDVLQIITEMIVHRLQHEWRVFVTRDRRYVHFLTFLAELSNGTPFLAVAMAAKLELPPEAATELVRSARSQINGWELLPGGTVKHLARNAVRKPTNADELHGFLSSQSRPTYPTAEAAAFYPNAPGDIEALIESGRLTYIEHYKFLAATPSTPKSSERFHDYWMQHLAPELRKVLDGAVPKT